MAYETHPLALPILLGFLAACGVTTAMLTLLAYAATL
jgi:hypothetical protein